MNLTKMTLRKNHKVVRVSVWGMLGITAILFFYIYGNLAQDDAYITFRYARNLALGRGFVYNDNEWVLGTTTPLYTILLAVVSYLSKVDIVRVNKIISAISLWVSAGLFYEIRKSLDSSGSFFLALIFITNPFLGNFIGMESYFLLFFFILTVWAYHTSKMYVSALCGGLLILIRYEMVFLIIIIGVWDYIKKRKLPYWLLPGIILVSVWLVYATIVFRSPIPLSASAKLLAPHVSFLFGGAIYGYMLVSKNKASLLIIIFSLIGIFGKLVFRRSFQEYAIIVLFSVVYIVVASLFAGSFPWYYAPLVPGFVVTVVYGVNYFSQFPVIDKLNMGEEKKQFWKKWVQIISIILVVIIQLMFWLNDLNMYQDKIGDNRYKIYKQVSDWLNKNATREQSIATFEIGYVGYFTDMNIVDLAGLVTPGLFSWVDDDDGAEAILQHALILFSPDFVLIPDDNTKQKYIMSDAVDYYIVEESFANYLLFQKE